MSLRVNFNILNQKGTPAFYSDVFSNRPAAGFAGRVFISTDTGAIYEDTGTAWTLIADAGAGTTGTLQQVTTNGNTTSLGLVVTAGNVAIGTATAGAPLDIHCTGTAAQFNGTGTNNAYVFFQNAGTNKWRFGNNYNANANSLDFFNSGLAAVVASFNANGSLLLNYNLAIKQGTGFNQVSGYSNIAADSGGFFFNTGGANNGYLNFANLTNSRSYTFPDANGTLALTSQITASQWTTSGSDIYYNTGNVLIGLTSSAFRLHVLAADGQIGTFATSDASGGYIGFKYNTNTNFGYIGSGNFLVTGASVSDFAMTTGGSGNLIFGTGAGNERMRITSGGNVLIGTATDSGYKLNVNGQPGANGYTLWTNYSDIRLKENIVNINADNILDKISKLRPVTFNYNDLSGYDIETKKRKVSGFIAQELKEIFPEMVGTVIINDIEYYDTNTSNLQLYIIKAIQELNEKLERNNIN